MKFFWPAPLDLIDPTFNFSLERGSFGSSNQKNQQYPHEIFSEPVYNGFLISKMHFDISNKSRWNASQLNRFYREGAKRFLRTYTKIPLEIMGDSGAYTKSHLEQGNSNLLDECLEVLNFYSAIGVDYGLSPDNIISGSLGQISTTKNTKLSTDWETRWNRTIELGDTFWHLHKRKKLTWIPIGIAQGWDANSYQKSVNLLQQIGYTYIALGGLNRLNNEDINNLIKACSEVKSNITEFHLLGVSRLDQMPFYSKCGITSFDSTTPLRQAINSGTDNYHYFTQNYLAIRVPQTYASPRLKKAILTHQLDIKTLLEIEKSTLESLRGYDQGVVALKDVLSILKYGIHYRKEENYLDEYKRLLANKPWKTCLCPMCESLGIEITILRNRERNLRRGFHNLFILNKGLKALFPIS